MQFSWITGDFGQTGQPVASCPAACRLQITTAALMFGLNLGFTHAEAGMYRWVDENGITIYSQTKPPQVEAQAITVAPGPSQEQIDAARKRLESNEKNLSTARGQRQTSQEQAAKTKEQQTLAKQNCETAQRNLLTLQHLTANSRVNFGDGQFVSLSEEDRQQRIQHAEQSIKDNCR